MNESRLGDAVLMLVAIELTLFGTIPEDGALIPLVFLAIAITFVVFVKELSRKYAESRESSR